MSAFISSDNLEIAVNLLNKGELIAFPTETVYGLGGNAYSDKIVASIFACKKRSEFNPISVCYPSLEKAAVKDVLVTDYARIIAEKFLPGPVTLVLQRATSSRISKLCSAGQNTIGIRVPANDIALRLLNMLDFPLAAPSANTSGQLSHTTPQEVANDLVNISIINGGRSNRGIESTIIDCCSDEKLRIIRQGALTIEEISSKCNIPIQNIVVAEKEKQFAINKNIVLNAHTENENDANNALLAFGEPFPNNNCKYVLNLSLNGDVNEAASNFFSMLSELNEKEDVQTIRIMPIPQIGIGKAINSRLNALKTMMKKNTKREDA